jgi:hypothetical protein
MSITRWCVGPTSAHCLVEQADPQLARGLDLAKRHGQVENAEEWIGPEER